MTVRTCTQVTSEAWNPLLLRQPHIEYSKKRTINVEDVRNGKEAETGQERKNFGE